MGRGLYTGLPIINKVMRISRARIFKLLRSLGMDSKESIPPTVLRQNVASHNVYVTKRNCY
jgi:hypothetical protein